MDTVLQYYHGIPGYLQTTFGLFFLLATAAVVRRVLLAVLRRIAKSWSAGRNRKAFAPLFADTAFLSWLAFLPATIYVYFSVAAVPNLDGGVVAALQRVALAGAILAGTRAFSHALRIADKIYRQYPLAASRPIKGYLQTVSLVAQGVAGISIVAVLLDKSPMVFLSGLGALTAILMLVFKDSLLSLVAGVQITTNDLLRVGDWIEMNQFNADGDVIDIALHSVTVQNWDKTITVIPAHKFLENAFRNWRGMHESGGRRIKRAVNIDVDSVRFLDAADIEKFRRYRLLREYIADKVKDIQADNAHLPEDFRDVPANTRRLTNLGTYRHYLVRYLRENPRIHQGLTFLVRQLAPTAEGVPLEIYVFTNDTRWAVYEDIQADIFDHVLAILPEFDLRYFQNPTGHDFTLALSRARPTDPPAAPKDVTPSKPDTPC